MGPGLKLAALLTASLTFALTPCAGLAQLVPPAPAPTQATMYAAAFTPGTALLLVLDTIRGARSTLLVAAHSLTRPVGTALRDAQRRGVKVFVVADGMAVQTGSFHYTSSAAQRNAENVLVVREAPALAEQYGAEWRLWDESTDLARAY